MIILFNGPDNVGKGTQIKMITEYMEEKLNDTFHYLHYSALSKKHENIEETSKNHYWEMFGLMKYALTHNVNMIFDRAEEGEWVYGKIYRNYNATWLFEMQKTLKKFYPLIYQFVFIDKPENLIKRDDGLSFTTELEKKKFEIDRFVDYFNRSSFTKKYLIDINEKNQEEVFNILKGKLNEII